MKLNLIIYIVLIAFVISCSDNSVNTGNMIKLKDYFPMTIGNYWIYEYTELDQNNQPTGKISIDSTVIIGTLEFNGKTFYQMIDFRDNSPLDTSYWYADDLKINQIADSNTFDIAGLQDTIFKMAELYTNNWFIFNSIKDSVNVDWDGEKHLSVTEYSINGYRNYGGDTVYIGPEQHVTLSFKIVSDRRQFLKYSTQQILLRNQPIYYYYEKGRGPIVIRSSSHKIFDKDNPNKYEILNGWSKEIIRWNIN